MENALIGEELVTAEVKKEDVQLLPDAWQLPMYNLDLRKIKVLLGIYRMSRKRVCLRKLGQITVCPIIDC